MPFREGTERKISDRCSLQVQHRMPEQICRSPNLSISPLAENDLQLATPCRST
jgi:hypothetical protein